MTIENILTNWRTGKVLFIWPVALILIFALATLSHAQSSPNPVKAAEALTHQLVGLNKRLQHASTTARDRVLDELQAVATERQALLAELIESDPGAVLRVAVPQRIRAGMPADVQDRLEQHIELAGELEVFYEDYDDGSHRLRHFINNAGKRIELHFKSNPPGLLSGIPAQANGVLLDDAMALESGENVLTLAAPGGGNGGGGGEAPAPAPNTLGEQKTLLILVNFQDNPIEPYTTNYAQNVMFGTTNEFYLENSQQQTWISGDTAGWFTIASNSSACDIYAIADLARSAASAAGLDVSAYAHLVYAFPRSTACGWWGLSSVGGSPSQAWVSGDFELGVTAHEFGHGMGLFHSHAKECGSTTLGDNCISYEYNDFFDTMGTSHFAHFNAFQKERLEWLNAGTSLPITTVTTDGTYVVDSYASNGQGPKALKILKSTDSSTGNKTWYYIQSRQAVGFDALDRDIAENANILNGLLIHTGTESNGNSSYLLDMTPESGSSIYWDWLDPALVVGDNFSDPDAGITITPESVSETSAAIRITFGQTQCVRGTPTISISPSQSQWAPPGMPVTYGITVTNTDSNACSTSSFDLSSVAPAGWNVEFDSGSLPLSPGSSNSASMVVTSPQTENEGYYDIVITASDSSDTTVNASTVATYVVEAGSPSCTAHAPQISISPASQSGNPGTELTYDISLTNLDSQECSASTFSMTRILPGWSGSVSPGSLVLAPGDNGQATLSATSLDTTSPGSYALQVMVYDDQESIHETSMSVTYVVNETEPVDNTPPTAPSGLTATSTSKEIGLSWNPSSDNIAVAGYRIWRDGIIVADTPGTGYVDRNLASNVIYEYRVDAYDGANNVSSQSSPVAAGKAKGKGSGGGKGKGNSN